MAPNRASDVTMVRSEPGPSLVELYVNEEISPLQLDPVMRVKMVSGVQEVIILMENTVKNFSWMENRLRRVWCPLLGCGYLAQMPIKPDPRCGVQSSA